MSAYNWYTVLPAHRRALQVAGDVIAAPQAIAGLIEMDTMCHAIGLLDWTIKLNNTHRIAGIKYVGYKPSHYPTGGWQGVAIRVTLDETQFFGQADALLFSEIREQFYTQYADIRRFTQLTVTLSQSGTQ